MDMRPLIRWFVKQRLESRNTLYPDTRITLRCVLRTRTVHVASIVISWVVIVQFVRSVIVSTSYVVYADNLPLSDGERQWTGTNRWKNWLIDWFIDWCRCQSSTSKTTWPRQTSVSKRLKLFVFGLDIQRRQFKILGWDSSLLLLLCGLVGLRCNRFGYWSYNFLLNFVNVCRVALSNGWNKTFDFL